MMLSSLYPRYVNTYIHRMVLRLFTKTSTRDWCTAPRCKSMPWSFGKEFRASAKRSWRVAEKSVHHSETSIWNAMRIPLSYRSTPDRPAWGRTDVREKVQIPLVALEKGQWSWDPWRTLWRIEASQIHRYVVLIPWMSKHGGGKLTPRRTTDY